MQTTPANRMSTGWDMDIKYEHVGSSQHPGRADVQSLGRIIMEEHNQRRKIESARRICNFQMPASSGIRIRRRWRIKTLDSWRSDITRVNSEKAKV